MGVEGLFFMSMADRDKFQLLSPPEYIPANQSKSGKLEFTGAYVRAFGVVFVILCVKPNVIDDIELRAQAQAAMVDIFGEIPVVLMADNSWRGKRYYGRTDIVNCLSDVLSDSIPLQRYTYSW